MTTIPLSQLIAELGPIPDLAGPGEMSAYRNRARHLYSVLIQMESGEAEELGLPTIPHARGNLRFVFRNLRRITLGEWQSRLERWWKSLPTDAQERIGAVRVSPE